MDAVQSCKWRKGAPLRWGGAEETDHVGTLGEPRDGKSLDRGPRPRLHEGAPARANSSHGLG